MREIWRRVTIGKKYPGYDKTRGYVDCHVYPYICTEFDDFDLNQKQSMDAKREWAIKFSVIHIFKAAESP